MTQHGSPIGAPRDVPPPRPVDEPVEGQVVGGDTGLGAAARAVADAVAGLLGRETPAGQAGAARRTAAGARAATGVLADVAAAVAAAAREAARPSDARRTDAGRDGDQTGDRTPGGLLGDLLDAAAPRLPVRDRDRLRRAHPGASDGEIADALVARAARLTGAIGAATGGLAAAQKFVPTSLLAVPLEVGAQTLLVGAVEVVLVGELHELAGRRPAGDARARAGAYLSSWTDQRAVGSQAAGGVFSTLGAAGIAALRRRITRTVGRSTTSMAPLMVGATLASRANRKATATLADRLRADLQLPPASPPH
jgi:hypothetical protein